MLRRYDSQKPLAARRWRLVTGPLLLALAGFVAGCSDVAAVKPPEGLLFTHYSAPLKADFSDGQTDISALKCGESHCTKITLPVGWGMLSGAWGDISVDKVARKAGLSEVVYADYEMLDVLSVYRRFTVRVYGK